MMDSHTTSLYVPDFVPSSDREYLEAQRRYGNRVGWGDRPAVLVVDMTISFLEERATGDCCLEATEELLNVARSTEVPVLFTVPGDSEPYPDGYPVTVKAAPPSDRGPDEPLTDEERAWLESIDEIPSAIAPREDEPVFDKPRASAFYDTHLSNLLHYLGVDTLIVAGLTTGGCVRATVVDSHSHNFRTILPVECVADSFVVSHETSLFDMDLRYADVTYLDTVVERLRDRT